MVNQQAHWILVLFIFGSIFIFSSTDAKESFKSEATEKLKVISESMVADDITEIQKLIEAGADVNVTNSNGETPLYVASSKNQTEVVKLLLEAGADVNKGRIEDGYTPLHVASHGNFRVVKLLLDAGADVNVKATIGLFEEITPVGVAVANFQPEIAFLLKAHGGKE